MKSVSKLRPIGLGLAMLGLAIAPLAAQGPVIHDVTDIQINEPTLIPGKVLPPGEYEIRVVNPTVDGDIVQFRNKKTNKVEATVIALTDYRTRITDKTVLQYWETPKDTPPALRAWFYPDEHWGEEFVYPTAMVQQIEAQRQIPQAPPTDYGSDAPLPAETAQQVDLSGIPKTELAAQTKSGESKASSNTLLAQANPSGANRATSKSSQASATTQTTAAQTTATGTTAASSATQTPPSSVRQAAQTSNTVLAQNRTKGTPAPTTPAQSNRAKSASARMPQTASPVPAVFLSGVGMLCGAVLLRRRRTA